MNSKKVRVIINPAAAGGRGRGAALELLEELDARSLPCEARYTERPGHAAELGAEAREARVRGVVVVGGDGTVHEVVGGLLAGGPGVLPPVCVFPAGTGNDFFRMVGAERNAAAVARVLEQGAVKYFDVGRVRWDRGESVFVNVLGVGVDVDVLRCRARFARLRGLAQYLAALLYALATYRAPEVRIDLGRDGRTLLGRTTLSVITVGPSMGGGFKVNPGARSSDGRLDLFHAPAMSLLRIMALVPRVIRGTHAGMKPLTMCRIEEARLGRTDGKPVWFEMDGELSPEPARELRVNVMPRVLPVMVPAHA
ncbi:MAG: diacylglycerol kinase family lipid kinase [Gemmatimonadetes bacterium]|nr:diacylglycerol kinase family lipid kinase [Gemmatimonadota bacterium]